MKLQHLQVGTVIVLASPSAFAYIDPGTGMMLWQGLIAAVGAALVFFRSPRQGIKNLIDRLKRK